MPKSESELVPFFTRQAGAVIRDRMKPHHLVSAIRLAFSHHFHEPVLSALKTILDDSTREDLHLPLLQALSNVAKPEHQIPVTNFFLDLASHPNHNIAASSDFLDGLIHAENLEPGFGREAFAHFLLTRSTRAAKPRFLQAYRYFGRNFVDPDRPDQMDRHEWVRFQNAYQRVLFKERPLVLRTLRVTLDRLRNGLTQREMGRIWSSQGRNDLLRKLRLQGASAESLEQLQTHGLDKRLSDQLKEHGVTQAVLYELDRKWIHRDVVKLLKKGIPNVLGLVLVGSHARGAGRKYKEMDIALTVSESGSPNSVWSNVRNYYAALGEILGVQGNTAEDVSRMRWINLEDPDRSFFPMLHMPFAFIGAADLSRNRQNHPNPKKINDLFWSQLEEHRGRQVDHVGIDS